MLERIAKTLHSEFDNGSDNWRSYIPEALAVLRALRDPTPEMLAASEFLATGASKDDVVEDWNAMINAAIFDGVE